MICNGTIIAHLEKEEAEGPGDRRRKSRDNGLLGTIV